jgi:hypothetical protein
LTPSSWFTDAPSIRRSGQDRNDKQPSFSANLPAGYLSGSRLDSKTEGETLAETIFNAAEVLSGILTHPLEYDYDIPSPSPVEGCPASLPLAFVQSAR